MFMYMYREFAIKHKKSLHVYKMFNKTSICTSHALRHNNGYRDK